MDDVYYENKTKKKTLAGAFICPVTSAPLQKITTGVPQVDRGWLLQTDTVSISLTQVTTSCWAMPWGCLWVNWEYENHRWQEGSLNYPVTILASEDNRTVVHHPTRRRRREQVVSQNTHNYSTFSPNTGKWSFIETPPRLKHTPDKHSEANRKISVSSDLRATTVQARRQFYHPHSHHPNAYLTHQKQLAEILS